MFEFLLSLLLLALSLQPFIPIEVKERISQPENISVNQSSHTLESAQNENSDGTKSESTSDSVTDSIIENLPDTKKINTYNTESGKQIGLVAAVAVEKSPVLIPCQENPSLCNPTTTISPTPTPSPTVVPPFDPPPTIYPPISPPRKCIYRPDIVCLDFACPLREDNSFDPCSCPCIPPSAY